MYVGNFEGRLKKKEKEKKRSVIFPANRLFPYKRACVLHGQLPSSFMLVWSIGDINFEREDFAIII